MVFSKFKIIALLLLINSLPAAFSQPLSLNITNLNTIDGLSQSSVLSIYKDRYGFMWFGTQDGLNKYDGFRFVVYKHLSNNPHSLPANNVNTVNEDSEGNIWAGTRLGGLSR